MLELRDIKKDYVVEKTTTQALKGISIKFREKEFVAILGPSGCGKTTLLNIVGGLDQYTSGDLLINNVSTKQYKDRDWDTYRNHMVGFVFQTYNLIPHQRVGANVELALTISGIPKEERKERVKAALAQVGLASQIRKRPNTLSGGQMQRVAIARALINNPQIILADEPTGALDSEASVKVMEILKKASADTLVVMVTHNPDLAYQYATRIIEMKDGEIINDSNPVGEDEQLNIAEQLDVINDLEAQGINTEGMPIEEAVAIEQQVEASASEKLPRQKKSKMTWKSAFKLSLDNLYSKKMRTLLTTFAGSIGIIGMTLVLALSVGASGYIAQVEENALAQYPIVIEETTVDFSKIFELLTAVNQTEGHEANSEEVYEQKALGNLLRYFQETTQHKNDLKSIKNYLDQHIDAADGFVKYNYGVNINIFADYDTEVDENGNVVKLLSHTGEYYLINPFKDNWKAMVPAGVESMLGTLGIDPDAMTPWEELIDNQELLDQQYDIVAGHWPNDQYADGSEARPFEVVLVTNEDNEIPDYLTFAIGLRNANKVMDAVDPDAPSPAYKISDLLNVTYKALTQSDYYYFDSGESRYRNYYTDENYYTTKDGAKGIFEEKVANEGLNIRIAGVIRPKKGVTNTIIKGLLGYTSTLTDFVINRNMNSDVYKAQTENITIKDDNTVYGTLANVEGAGNGKVIEESEHMSYEDYVESYLAPLGYANLQVPKQIYIYASSLDGKANIMKVFDQYEAEGKGSISYSDTISLIMSSVGQIINAVTYVLIGFSAISLVVSSIMIAIITYTSVVERTREIGVLRSIGARKKDIATIFNSETLMEGFLSGVMGVFFAWLLSLVINAVVYAKYAIVGIADMVWWHVILMILLSVGLSFIAGLVPSQLAAKKDPVYALRSDQ